MIVRDPLQCEIAVLGSYQHLFCVNEKDALSVRSATLLQRCEATKDSLGSG